MENNLEKMELDCQLRICSKCGGPIQKVVVLFGKERIVPIVCSCTKQEMEEKQQLEINNEKQERLKRLFTSSLIDKKFITETFENWDFNKGSKQMYNIGEKYCKNFNKAKEEGLGLLLHGTPGNGKTYLSNCIANKLLNSYVPVISVSINALLQRIQRTYNSWGKEAEDGILQSLANADLLVIDDLGSENDTDWSRSRVYNIIDSRYRNGLPLIVSTNKSIKELKDIYHERTIDRLLEMCTPLEHNGQSIRAIKAQEKTRLLKEILK